MIKALKVFLRSLVALAVLGVWISVHMFDNGTITFKTSSFFMLGCAFLAFGSMSVYSMIEKSSQDTANVVESKGKKTIRVYLNRIKKARNKAKLSIVTHDLFCLLREGGYLSDRVQGIYIFDRPDLYRISVGGKDIEIIKEDLKI